MSNKTNSIAPETNSFIILITRLVLISSKPEVLSSSSKTDGFSISALKIPINCF